MSKYRKKPVVIEAIKYDGENKVEIQEFVGKYLDFTNKRQLKIDTLEGVMLANIGDYIIKGVKGEFYPCKPDIFEKTYEKVQDENPCKNCEEPCYYCDYPCKEAAKYLRWKEKAIKKIEKALKKKGFKPYKGLNVNGMLWFIINFWEDINIWEEFKK